MAPKRKMQEVGSSSGKKAPDWESGKLSEFDPKWRPILYKRKLDGAKKLEDVIVAERKTILEDFRNFGLVECFEKLGWMATLTFNNDDRGEVYLTEIIEWMSTLKRELGNNPPWTTRLVGTVNKKDVELTMETLLTVAPFDSKPQHEYVTKSDAWVSCEGDNLGPIWEVMITELFAVRFTEFSTQMKLKMKQLKPLPRLIYKIFPWNVIPRRSDKNSVRKCDVRALYALVTGQPMIPFRQLIMMSVWDSYENKIRTSIPHCRLLSRLLSNAGVIPKRSLPNIETNIPFCRTRLGAGEFSFKETVHYFLLQDDKNERVHRIAKDEMGDGFEEGENENEREYVHGGRRELVRDPSRPASYNDWTPYQQLTWDRDSIQIAEARQWREEQRVLLQCQAYQCERYYKNLFDFFEQVRHREDYQARLSYQEEYTRVNYQTVPPYDPQFMAGTFLRYPQMQSPDWWPRSESTRDDHQNAGPSNVQPESAEPSNPFDTSPVGRSFWESIFKPPGASHALTDQNTF